MVGLLNSPETNKLREEGKFGYVARHLEYTDNEFWTTYVSVDIYNNYHVHNKIKGQMSLFEQQFVLHNIAKKFHDEWERDGIFTSCDSEDEFSQKYLEALGFEWFADVEVNEDVTTNIYKYTYKELQ